MAPPDNNAALGLQSNKRRPAPIVPAIPLPLIQKRKIQTPASAASPAEVRRETPRANGYVNGVGIQPVAPTAAVVDGAKTVPAIDAPVNGVPPADQQRPEGIKEADDGREDARRDLSVLASPPTLQPTLQPAGPEPGYACAPEQILPQFPVPDYPSVPPSAASAYFPPPSMPYAHAPYHASHPSHGSIIFGGYSDTTSSPATPPLLATNAQDPPIHMPGGQNGVYHAAPELHASYAQPVMAPANAAHAHAFPAFFPPLDLYFPPRVGLEHANFQERSLWFAPSDNFTPTSPAGTPADAHPTRTPSVTGSGGYASMAQSRSGSSLGRETTIPEEEHDVQPEYPVNGRPDNSQSSGMGAMNEERHEYVRLPSHLSSQFDNDEFADCVVELRHTKRRFQDLSVRAHRVLLSQSPYLRELLPGAPRDDLARSVVSLETTDRFLEADAFRNTLRYLYGTPMHELLDPCWPVQSPESASHAVDHLQRQVDATLALIAAGTLLQIDQVTSDAVRRASGLIRWESLEKVLAFASRRLFDNRPSSEERTAAKSAGDESVSARHASHGQIASLANPSAHHPTIERNPSLWSPYANQLLYAALDFIIQNFPPQFALDASAPQLSMMPRLPDIKESESPNTSRWASHLKTMRFGDIPLEGDARREASDNVSGILSSTLLSLPFDLVRHILEAAEVGTEANGNGPSGMDARESLAREVLAERELRRRKVLLHQQQQRENTPTSKSDPATQATPDEPDEEADNEWDALNWEEFIEPASSKSRPPSSPSKSSSRSRAPSQPPWSPTPTPRSSSITSIDHDTSKSSTVTIDHETPSSSQQMPNRSIRKRGFRLKRRWVGHSF